VIELDYAIIGPAVKHQSIRLDSNGGITHESWYWSDRTVRRCRIDKKTVPALVQHFSSLVGELPRRVNPAGAVPFDGPRQTIRVHQDRKLSIAAWEPPYSEDPSPSERQFMVIWKAIEEALKCS
jgi:hypothetical protein